MSALKRLKLQGDNAELVTAKQYSQAQAQTEQCFDFKWQQRDTYESGAMKEHAKKWMIERYLNNEPKQLLALLADESKIILDAGCGSGFSALLFFGEHLKSHDYLGIDISDAVWLAKTRFAEAGFTGDFLKCDLLQMPIPANSIDIIFSEGVLHHTDSTERAISVLSDKLKPSGKLLFYVYAKKAVIREFTDDHIREQLKNMNDSEAWEALRSLTKLGMELGKLNIDINVQEDIPYLGIKKGSINLQRFFYWNICKLFYNPEFNLDEMTHINFDWFRPANCHRHTPEEITTWCQASGLSIDRMNVQEAGITVVATKLAT